MTSKFLQRGGNDDDDEIKIFFEYKSEIETIALNKIA